MFTDQKADNLIIDVLWLACHNFPTVSGEKEQKVVTREFNKMKKIVSKKYPWLVPITSVVEALAHQRYFRKNPLPLLSTSYKTISKNLPNLVEKVIC